MATKFKRSEATLYPQIYHTFKAKDIDGDGLVEYCVEDMTEKHFDKALDFISKYFMPEEVFSRAAKIPGNETAEKAFKEYYRKVVNEKFSLVCFKHSTYELVALNSFTVETRGLQSEIGVKKTLIFENLKSFFRVLRNILEFLESNSNLFLV